MEKNGNSDRLFSLASKSLWMVMAAMKLRHLLLGRKAMKNLDSSIKKQRYHFVDKGPYSQSYVFSSSHVQMWELDPKEGWAPKKGCFWTVLEKTFENPFDKKEIKLVSPKGNQSWIFIGRTDAETEAPILWPPDAKGRLVETLGKPHRRNMLCYAKSLQSCLDSVWPHRR